MIQQSSIESIFIAALEQESPDARAAYLEEACAGQPEVRARVEELLQADAGAGSFLNSLAGVAPTIATNAVGDTVDDGPAPVSLSFLQPCHTPGRIGKLVGKSGEYEVIEVVGRGGMGAVLRAFETKLSRIVAVKVMAPELAANPMAVKRFLREATTAAAVHHEHVVTIHAIDPDHRPPFLVMQYVDGQNLQQKIDCEGALDLPQILRIGSQMAAGLAAAHRQGLIHRDVKPANILLENGVERVKITDFGLARAADDLEMTQAGLIAGTPQYMSPEQARGEPVDARSDLFSLGSVLYTMCTGRPGFRAETTMGVLKRVCEDSPRPIHEVNAEIPIWLCEIVDKLLEKRPQHRLQSAQEVADLLAQHLAHLAQPQSCPPPPRIRSENSSLRALESNVLISAGNLLVVSGMMSLILLMLRVSVPAWLSIWCLVGGPIAVLLALVILAGQRRMLQSQQSHAWATAAGRLALLPLNPFWIFGLPFTIMMLRNLRHAKPGASRQMPRPATAAVTPLASMELAKHRQAAGAPPRSCCSSWPR